MSRILAGARVVTPDRVIEPGWVHIEGSRIAAIGEGAPPTDVAPLDDTGGAWILPGYVDVHVHGGNGGSIEASAEGLATSVAFHRSHGTTRTLASLATAPAEKLIAAAGWIADAVEAGPTPTGHVLGCHFEGPFLSHARCGAQDPNALREPDPVLLKQMLDASRGTARMVTIAPELPGGLDLIKQVVAAGAVAAVGHTDSTYDQAMAGIDAGATAVTHTFNGMRGLHHRDPGTVGVATDTNVICEAVNDGIHLHDATLRLLARLVGDRLCLITDAMAAAGVGDGVYRLGAREVTVTQGKAMLTGKDSIAGSTLTMDRAVARAVRAGLPVVQVAHAAATAPARLLGQADRFGSLTPGLDADLVILDDDLEIQRIMASGVWSDR